MSESNLRKLCTKLAKIRNSSLLSFVLPRESLISSHLLTVYKLIKNKKCKKLDIILHSGGGDINAAYQIIELLRDHCESMTTIVPLYAKSAATLFVLGSDSIVMGEIAELGPLDTQMREQERGGMKYVSALNPFKTLEELQRFSLETFDVTVKMLLARAALSVDEAIKHSMDFASRIVTPLFSKLDTEKVGQYSRALAIGKEYGLRLVRRYSKWKKQRDIDTILEKFIKGYPSHRYVIDYKELKDLDFDVILPVKGETEIIEAVTDELIKLQNSEIFFIDDHCKIEKKKEKGEQGGK